MHRSSRDGSRPWQYVCSWRLSQDGLWSVSTCQVQSWRDAFASIQLLACTSVGVPIVGILTVPSMTNFTRRHGSYSSLLAGTAAGWQQAC